MTDFVALSRRFCDLTGADLDEPELLTSLGHGGFLWADGWPEVLRHRRVVLLAEAGSGKTREMREQAARLRAEGRFAFFAALEDLDRNGLAGSLRAPGQKRALAEWLADGNSPAWFFLDSVDELKLVGGKFRRALELFAEEIGDALDRAHVVVSCRPTDWRPVQDMEAVRVALPLPPPASPPTPQETADEAFAAALREAETGQRDNKEESGGTREEKVRTVAMLPLGERQIEAFARSLGVGDPAAFLAEIRRRDAWTFAHRPLDLIALAEIWRDTGELGTRARQHEASVAAKLRDDPERPDRGALPDTLARQGAERLALALALGRTRTISSPEQAWDPERGAGALDPAAVLPDWTEERRQSLLRRALFDPATYGRVRFHHRSVQEYLAARRLAALREKGMTARGLLRLLFAERYGVQVAVASLRPVAAWLALADADVRRELISREPEALLSLGDPEALPVATRAELLKVVASAGRRGSGAELNVPTADARRLAHPELAGVVREVWQGGDPGDEVRELLLEMVWQGRMEACADLAEGAVRDAGFPDHLRALGFRALVACGRDDAARRVASSIMREPAPWPERLLFLLAPDLFPAFISVGELMALVERTREPEGVTGTFGWFLREMAEEVDPWSGRALELRSGLAGLLWRGRHERLEWHRLKGRFDHVAPALAVLCARQLPDPRAHHDPGLIRASALANRFGRERSDPAKVRDRLRRCFGQDPVLREAAFWDEVSLMDEVAPTDDDWRRLYHAQHASLLKPLAQADRGWLEAALADHADPRRRGVALQGLLELWGQRGRPEAEGEALRHAVADDARLSDEAVRRTAPPELDPHIEKMQRDQRRTEFVRRGREERRLADWTRWRGALLADPEAAFGPEERQRSVANIYAWLSARFRDRNRYDVWDAAALEAAFGPGVARRAAEAFRGLWRSEPPILWSRRPAEDRNAMPFAWARGLCGLAAEAASPGWASRLTTAEARTAAAYATVEMNGFPRWMADLAAAHPDEVAAVLGDELAAELTGCADHQHLPVLQGVLGADAALKGLLAPRLAAAVAAWPAPSAAVDAGGNSARHLAAALRLLDEVAGDAGERRAMAAVCRARHAADPGGPLAPAWLKGLFRFDPAEGVEALEAGLAAPDGPAQTETAVATFAALFGERDGDELRSVDPTARLALLGRLVRCAYLWIRREDDVEHGEEAFFVDARDRAETARSFLLSALLDAPGQGAHDVLLRFASDPLFAHLADRFRSWARQRAVADAEPRPLGAADIVALETRLEAPPRDRDGLFDTMRDRLDDLSHEIAHDDFTIRSTLRGIGDEAQMQRYLAGRLRQMARDAYAVDRESEVADNKRTDIRLTALRGEGQRAVIEIKIADKGWTLEDLERALRVQLVGQYLRDRACKAGCLLVTYAGKRKFWVCPATGARLDFTKVIGRLARVATEVEAETAQGMRVAVHGLDLTDPNLQPAHR